jgi:nucleotide-binding universal stress UspA family protein
MNERPRGSIFHPSDFSEASEVAFAHALKIALVTRSQLNVLHVSADSDARWSDFPGVRETLERWRLIPAGSPKQAVANLGIDVRKVMLSGSHPVRSSLGFLERHPADLVVLAVHQYEGRMRWMADRVAEPIARSAGEGTLFIPHGVRGFVSREDGSVSLRNILIPIAGKPPAQPAVDAAARLIANLQLASGTVTLLFVGDAGDAPAVKIPEGTGWTWNRLVRDGDADSVILEVAGALQAGLIIMTTDGPDGFLDGLRGTTSERVLRKSPCPVANLPVGSSLG